MSYPYSVFLTRNLTGVLAFIASVAKVAHFSRIVVTVFWFAGQSGPPATVSVNFVNLGLRVGVRVTLVTKTSWAPPTGPVPGRLGGRSERSRSGGAAPADGSTTAGAFNAA